MFGIDPLEGRNSVFTRNAEHEATAAKRRLAQAEQRIAALEKALVEAKKNAKALLAVANTVTADLVKIAPERPLAQKENRLKIYDANYRL